MAKRSKSVEDDILEAGIELSSFGTQQTDDEPEREPTPEERDLAMMMSQLSAENKSLVTVYRETGKRGSRGGYVMSFHPSRDLTEVMDYLRDAKRGGEFRFQVHDGQKLVGRPLIIVEPPTPEQLREYEKQQQAENQRTQAAMPHAPQDDKLTALIQAMREESRARDEQYRREREEREAREERARREQQDREERLREREEAARERERDREQKHNEFMMSLLVNKNQPAPQTGLTEMITALATLQTLTGSQKRETDPLDIVDKVLNIKERLVSDEGGKEENVLNTAIKHLGAPLAGLALQLAKKPGDAPPPRRENPVRQAPPVPQQQLPAPEQGTVPAPEQTPAPVPEPEAVFTYNPELSQEENLAMLFQKIIDAATQNLPVEPYGDALMDSLGEDACADIVIDDEKYAFVLQSLGNPVTETNRDWFDRLREYMVDSLYEDAPDASDADAEGDDEQDSDISDEAGE